MPDRHRTDADRQVTLRLRYRPSLDELIGSIADPSVDRSTVWDEPAGERAVLRWTTDPVSENDVLAGFTVPAADARGRGFWSDHGLDELGRRVMDMVGRDVDRSLGSISDARRHLRSADSQVRIERGHLMRPPRGARSDRRSSEPAPVVDAVESEPDSRPTRKFPTEVAERLGAAMTAAGRAIEMLDSDDPEATGRLVHLAAELVHLGELISASAEPAPSLASRINRFIRGGMSLTPREIEHLRRGLQLSAVVDSWEQSTAHFIRLTRSIGGQIDV